MVQPPEPFSSGEWKEGVWKKLKKRRVNMWGHEGMMWGFGGWWMTIVWIAVVVGIVFLVKWLLEQGRTGGQASQKEESALDILKKRYARGEIDKEEFEQKKRDLTGA